MTSLHNQQVSRPGVQGRSELGRSDRMGPEFPFSYKINAVVSAITFSINESHLNLSSNWMFFFKQIRKRIYR